jgi:hypothetical protein
LGDNIHRNFRRRNRFLSRKVRRALREYNPPRAEKLRLSDVARGVCADEGLWVSRLLVTEIAGVLGLPLLGQSGRTLPSCSGFPPASIGAMIGNSAAPIASIPSLPRDLACPLRRCACRHDLRVRRQSRSPAYVPANATAWTDATFDAASEAFEAAWRVSCRNGTRPIFRLGAITEIGSAQRMRPRVSGDDDRFEASVSVCPLRWLPLGLRTHPERPWEGEGACQRSRGAPCPVCNAADPAQMPLGIKVEIDKKGRRH